MTEVVALLTGTTGFLGQKFLNLLRMVISMPVITVSRGNKCTLTSRGQPFYLKI